MKPVATPFSQIGIWRSSRGAREAGCNSLERLAHAASGEIDLIEEQQARNAGFLEFAQDNLQRRRLALIRLADDHGRIADRQHVSHVVHEFDRAGAVDEGQAVAHVVDMGDVWLDAHRVSARLGARESPTLVPSRTEPCRDAPPPRASKPSSRLVLPLWNGPTIAISRGPAILWFACRPVWPWRSSDAGRLPFVFADRARAWLR